MANPELPAPKLDFIFEAQVTVDPPQELGDVGKGSRRIVPISGGEFSGPDLRGEVLPGGADWQIVRGDGVAELEARYTLRSDDGALIYVRNIALRHGAAETMAALAAGRPVDPDRYYFRRYVFRNERRALCVDRPEHHCLHRCARAGDGAAAILQHVVRLSYGPSRLRHLRSTSGFAFPLSKGQSGPR